MQPLALQQVRVYPETVTGRFVSLVDFEDAESGLRGFEQVGLFSIHPRRTEGACRFVVNITRTGAGAMEAHLPKGSRLVFPIPGYRDFTGYSLVSFALYSETLRDDLRMTLTTDSASWTSHRTLVRPGWNTVMIDIRRLQLVPGFDITSVSRIALGFVDAAGPVRFNLDDIMLLDNARKLEPAPKGITLYKSGLDYRITLPHRPRPIVLAQCGDGLWRVGTVQPIVQIAPPDQSPPPPGEHLELMGPRRVGQVKVLETNRIRMRLGNTWYFPTRPGEWISLGIRRIQWEYTFYGDGRWVTHVEVNNSGGREIGTVRIWVGEEVAWSGRGVSCDLLVRRFPGPVGRWSFLAAPNNLQKQTLRKNYLAGGTVETMIAARGVFAPGDFDRDGFDESQGCYFLKSVKGHCRFRIVPPFDGLLNPVFRLAGRWSNRVSVSAHGLMVRNIVHLPDKSILFTLPGWIRRTTAIEVTDEATPAAKG